MKKFLKEGYNVFEYKFDTLYEFTKFIQQAPINTNVFNSYTSSTKPDTEWTGTRSFEEAIDICQEGWSENFDKLLRLKRRVDEKLLTPMVRKQQFRDVIGFTPSVPDYLIGNPLNMWNKKNAFIPTFINIYMNISFSSGTSKEAIYNRGIIVQSIVDVLQSKGYGVRFYVFEASTEGDEMIISYYNLKGEGEKLNLKKTYFPLCHPSFIRRLIFRLQEVTPCLNSGWQHSYGKPSGKHLVKKIVNPGPNDIIITQPSEIGIDGYDIDDDLESFLRETQLQDILTKI